MNELDNETLPPSIMPDVLWSFEGQQYLDRPLFESDVRNYCSEILALSEIIRDNPWVPEQIVFPAGQLRIGYRCWENDRILQRQFTLEASNGRYFSAGELLFSIHNLLVEPLRGDDHHYFEGLWLSEAEQGEGHLPLYEVALGS